MNQPARVDAYACKKGVCRFACPHCKEVLDTQLVDASKPDACPACGGHFVSPGDRELAEAQRKLAERDEQSRIAKAQRDEATAHTRAKKQQERETIVLPEQPTIPETELRYPALVFFRSLLRAAAVAILIFWLGTSAFVFIMSMVNREMIYNPEHRAMNYEAIAASNAIEAYGESAERRRKLDETTQKLNETPMEIRGSIAHSLWEGLRLVWQGAWAVLTVSLLLWIAAELTQLALDARYDIAKLAASANARDV